MEPKFKDGETVQLRDKSRARNPHMKKGLLYLVRLEDGYTFKRYNTRPATKKEIEKGISYTSIDGTPKVKILESLNPAHPEIIITDNSDWVAWYEEAKD